LLTPPHRALTDRSRSRTPPRQHAERDKRGEESRKAEAARGTKPDAGDAAGGQELETNGTNGDDDEVVTKVIDGAPNRAGDSTWLAEIYVPRPKPQRAGTICVRGPLRFGRNLAESDATRLTAGYKKGGYKEVQEVRNLLRIEAR